MAMTKTSVGIIPLLCWAVASQIQLKAATAGSPQLVQAIVGFNAPNTLGLPCTSCLGFPAGTVWIQPDHFVSAGSSGLYYAVFQENGWSGNLNSNFQLSGGGGVLQDVILNGTLTNGQGLLVLSASETIPDTTYSGPATLTVTTTATPNDGSPPFILASMVDMMVGTTNIRGVVQVFAGLNASNDDLFPCTDCGPPGTIGIQPDQFPQPGTSAVEYVLFESAGWYGTVNSTMDLIEKSGVVQSLPLGALIDSRDTVLTLISADFSPAGNGYIGPAALRVSSTATSRHGSGEHFTYKSFSPLTIQ